MTSGRGHHPNDEGFTLVELLVVIIVLGVLATITVLAVSGIIDQGEQNADAADERTLVTAQEAHRARFNSYATEADLVTAGVLSNESSAHDIELTAGGTDYTIIAEGTGTTVASTTPVTTPVTTPETIPETTLPSGPTTTLAPGPHQLHSATIAGYTGQAYGSGPNKVVIISDGSSFLGNWNQIVAEGVELPTTEVIWLVPSPLTGATVDAIVAANPRYVVAAASVPMTNPNTFVGQYLSTRLPSSQFWWGHQDGGLMLMIDHYKAVIVPGG